MNYKDDLSGQSKLLESPAEQAYGLWAGHGTVEEVLEGRDVCTTMVHIHHVESSVHGCVSRLGIGLGLVRPGVKRKRPNTHHTGRGVDNRLARWQLWVVGW